MAGDGSVYRLYLHDHCPMNDADTLAFDKFIAIELLRDHFAHVPSEAFTEFRREYKEKLKDRRLDYAFGSLNE